MFNEENTLFIFYSNEMDDVNYYFEHNSVDRLI